MGGQGARVSNVQQRVAEPWQAQLAEQSKQAQELSARSGAYQTPFINPQQYAASRASAPIDVNAAQARGQTAQFGGFQQGAAAQQLGGQQQQLIGQLQQSAAGQGPSVAGQTIGQGVAASLAAQNAAMASARGGNFGSLMRQQAENAAATQAQGTAQAAQARIQEQQAAQQALGSVLQGARGQELEAATTGAQMGLQSGQFNAQQLQQAVLANQQAQNQVALQNAAAQQQASLANQQAMNQAGQFNAAQRQAAGTEFSQLSLQAQQQKAQQQMALLAMQQGITGQSWGIKSGLMGMQQQADLYNAGASDRSNASTMSTIGNLASAGIMLAALSDKRAKKDIKHVSGRKLGELLSKAGAHEYSYRDPDAPGAGPDRYISPMAQELDKSELGRNMVETGPDGHKMVHYGRGLGFILAAQSYLHKRLERLEKLERKAG